MGLVAGPMDMRLAYVLLERIKPGAQLIIVGDADQLPSVGAGNVLREMIRSEKVPYSEFKADSELNRNIINIDISAKRSHKSKFPKVDNVLICEEDDVYRLDFTEELALCRKTLGIRELRIIGSNSRLCANIEKNVSYLGITVSDIWQKKEESERNVLLSELFGRHGEKKPLYYIYELFNRIEQPFTRLNPNCILHDKGGNLNITAFNIDNGDEKLLYKFDISGLEDGDDYICIKTEARCV